MDANDNGVCDNQEVFGCTNPVATNFDAEANVDDGGCLGKLHLPNGPEL